MNNYEDDYTIDLKQLIVYVLKKWYIIIVIMILCGGAMAVLGARASKTDAVKVVVPTSADVEDRIKNYENNNIILNQEIDSINVETAYYEDVIKSYQAKVDELKSMTDGDAESVQDAVIAAMAKIDEAKLEINDNNQRLIAIEWELSENNRLIEVTKDRFTKDIPQKNKELIAKGQEALPYTSYEEYLDMRENGKIVAGVVIKPSVKDIVKKGIIGAVLGVVLGGVIILFRYFTNGQLKDIEYLKTGYKVPVLRMIYPYCGKKRCFYNRMIDKMEGYSNPKATEEEEYEVLAGKLNLLVGDSKELVITGIVDSEVLNATSAKITCAVNNKKYSVVTVENPAENVVDTEALKTKKVVLVGKKDELITKRLEALIDILKMAECDILGIVLI